MTKDELIRDLCSVDFRIKSKTRGLIEEYTNQVRLETIKELEEMLPDKYIANDINSSESGFNVCIDLIKSSLNNLK